MKGGEPKSAAGHSEVELEGVRFFIPEGLEFLDDTMSIEVEKTWNGEILTVLSLKMQ
ncbi:MAG: hypothetical protein U9R40_04225 [Synergistota bacterium]|nr:hypothetical protein [Synergistota bacterium]